MKIATLLSVAGASLVLSTQALALPLVVSGFEHAGTPTVARIQNATPSVNTNVKAGGFRTDAGGNIFTSWCVDIFQNTYFGQTVNDFSLTDGASALGADRANALGRLATTALASVTDANSSGAFQLAIWEIINETAGNAYNLSAGNFISSNVSGSALALAQSWLDNLGSLNSYTINVWQSRTRQDLAAFERVTVPEPASLAMLGLGLALAGYARRRAKRL